MAQRRQAWVKLLQDSGYTPRFISSEQIERGELKRVKALVLCNSIALSDEECRAIDEFSDGADDKRMLAGSGTSGQFDQHGRLRSRPGIKVPQKPASKDSLTWCYEIRANAGNGMKNPVDLRDWLSQRGSGQALPEIFANSTFRTVIPPAIVVPPDLAIRTHRYRLGPARLVAFERNLVWQMGEDLKQHGGNTGLERPVSFEAKLLAKAHVYDLRSGKYLGHTDAVPVDLDPWRPSLFALLEQKLEDGMDIVAHLARQ
jgi:hypothetical protein